MGRQRSLFLLEQLQRRHPEAYRNLTREVERVERETRSDGDPVRLRACCCVLLQLLDEHKTLLPFIAQGCPSCLTAVLSTVGRGVNIDDVCEDDKKRNNGDDCTGDVDLLRLAVVLSVSGSLIDSLADGVNKNVNGIMVLVFSAEVGVGDLALLILDRAIRLSPDGEGLAGRILNSETFWMSFSRAFFGDDGGKGDTNAEAQTFAPAAPPSVLARALSLLRCCCMVSMVGRNSSFNAMLTRVCAVVEAGHDTDVRQEAILLLNTLRVTSSENEAEYLRGHIAAVAQGVPAAGVGECACFPGNGRGLRFLELLVNEKSCKHVDSTIEALISLQKNRFECSARLRDLQRIGSLLFDPQIPYGTASALLVLLPGAVTSVFAAASDVDEEISAFACALFSSAIEGLQGMLSSPMNFKTAEQELPPGEFGTSSELDTSFYRRCLVEDFVLLGGMVLLEDLLLDYSSGVVSTAARLVRSLMCFSDSMRNLVLASKCIPNLCKALEEVSSEPNLSVSLQHGEENVCALLHVTLEMFSLLGADAVWVLPESVVSSVSVIATEARGNIDVLAAALRALVVLAAAHPMAATVVLDYDYLNNVLGMGGDDAADATGGEKEESCALSETDTAYICGSFDIMSAVVLQEPSCVTFEWIETLIMAAKGTQRWQGGTPKHARSLWEVVMHTITVSEEGRMYLLEDLEFVDILLRTMACCCRSCMGQRGEIKYTEVSGEDDSSSSKMCNAPSDGRHSAAAELLPLLLGVAKHLPTLQLPDLPEDVCNLVEAVAVIIAMRGAEISRDLLADTVIFLYNDDALLSVVLDMCRNVEHYICSELEGRAISAISSLDGIDVDAGENESRCTEALCVIKQAMLALSAILPRCRPTNGGSAAEDVIEGVSTLILDVLRPSSGQVFSFLELRSVECAPSSSWQVAILRSTAKLLRSGHQALCKTTRKLWYEHRVFQRVAHLLEVAHERNDAEELRDSVFDVLSAMHTLHNPWVAASAEDDEGWTPSTSFDVKDLVTFAVNHAVGERFLRSSDVCRSLFARFCSCPLFRRGMISADREAYLKSLELISDCCGDAAQTRQFNEWFKEGLDDVEHGTVL